MTEMFYFKTPRNLRSLRNLQAEQQSGKEGVEGRGDKKSMAQIGFYISFSH